MSQSHSAERKARVAFSNSTLIVPFDIKKLIREQHTASEIGAREGLAPGMLNRWRRELEQSAYRAFSVPTVGKAAQNAAAGAQAREDELMSAIGRLTVENA